ETLDECILVLWLRDSGRTAAFTKAIRAIVATTGGELMLDKPRGIYENPSNVQEARSMTEDIWDGSILLNIRIDLFTMVNDISNEILTYKDVRIGKIISDIHGR